MDNLKVYASPAPFSNKQVELTVPLGASVHDIVLTALDGRFDIAAIGAVVMIDGRPVPRADWSFVRPHAGNHNIAVRIVPQGGGGKKNPLASLLSIAVMVAAPYVGAALAGVAGFGGLWVGSTFFSSAFIYSTAFSVIGRLAISALAPPPKQSNAGSGNVTSNPTESPTQFIEGARNALSAYGVVPVNLGVNRMFPPQAARPYVESENNDQYVRQLFTYGYGQEIVIADLKIGETSLSEFSNFEMEHKLNGDLHEGTTIYTNDVYQEDMSVLLLQVDGFSTRTTQQDVDEAVIDVTFPQGLCQYNAQAKRLSQGVRLEVQYAETGVSPQDWSPGIQSYKSLGGDVLDIDDVTFPSGGVNVKTRTDSVYIDKNTGSIGLTKGQDGYTGAQPIPQNAIRIASVFVTTTRNPSNGSLSTDITVQDDRQSSLYGNEFENSSSFVPSKTGSTEVTVSGGGLINNNLDVSGNQKEALRRSVRIRFPQNGQYDIRIRRVTSDYDIDQVFDDVYLSAIKSIKYQSPVNLPNLNGTAMRIRGTDQLNGQLETFNAIVSTVIPDYDSASGTWVNRITSNPASIYRYVLQGAPNGKALADSKINISDLEDWHIYCEQEGYTYNRVIDYETTVDDILRDVASAGSASPAIVDGKRTVAIDMPKDDIVQIITPRNSWAYSGEMIYPDLPHAFRVQFRNADKGYVQDERMVYDDGYDASNATKFEALEVQSCTNADMAFKLGRRHLAAARLRPESHSWMMDVENLVALRGNRVKLVHDVPIIGVGDGRIKTVQTDGNSPALVTGFTIDDTVTIPSSGTYYARIRLADGTQLYKELTTSVGSTSTFTFAVPFAVADTPAAGDLCYFVEAGGELDLIITRIEPQSDMTARITAIDYAHPAIKTAESAPIPAFVSNITTPLEFIRPLPPVLLDQQSDESVMLRNSDGSFTPRAVFTLENRNEGQIETSVKIRVSGTTAFTNADVLEATPERLILTGLEDGKRYDILIRYRRVGGTVFSLPLELNNYLFIGASGTPDDVTGFKINVVEGSALLKWDANDDIDLSHYIVKFSPVYSGAAWGTALVLESTVYENRVTVPFQGGTYLVKAVDLSGNESDDAAVIVTYDPGTIANAVALVEESPDFSGALDNAVVLSNVLYMADPDAGDGYYYFDNIVDLTDVFPAFVSATIVANGAYINNLFDVDDIFALDDVFGAGGNDIFAADDIFAMDDVFGIGNDAWEVALEYSITTTDPNTSPADWSDWAPLEAGTLEFWGIKFRLKMTSMAEDVSPAVSQLSVLVDMPDRIERGEDLECVIAGATVTFTPEFKETPAIAITLQDGAVDDRIEFTAKSAGGFTFKVYNQTAGGYVARSFDFIASGYGRKNA